MTQLLEEAISKVRDLPPNEQDAVAPIILDEIADGGLWDDAFARSNDKLAEMARKVRSDVKAGRVRTGGFDDL